MQTKRIRLIAVMLLSVILLVSCTDSPISSESSTAVDSSVPDDNSESAIESCDDDSDDESSCLESVSENQSDDSSLSSADDSSEDSPMESSEEPVSEPLEFADLSDGFLPELEHIAGETVDLLSGIHFAAGCDSNEITLSVIDTGKYDAAKAGTYTITVQAIDQSGEQITAKRNIKVTKAEKADNTLTLQSNRTPYVINDKQALSYTTSGTQFRIRDILQIMDTDTFTDEYHTFEATHTNNGKIPFFPNGVIVFLDKQQFVQQIRIASGTTTIEEDADGTTRTDGLSWTNSIDASSGGGMFKGILDDIKKILPGGGYLLFVGNPQPETCRAFLIQNLFFTQYVSGAVSPESKNVSLASLRIIWETGGDKDPDEKEPDNQDSKIVTTMQAEDAMSSLPIYTKKINGEILNPADPELFKGAYYRKVISSRDYWAGIEATVTLPEYNIRRYNGTYNESLAADPNVKNLDNPSVYLGGTGKYETDIGLALSKGLIKKGNSTSVSTGNVCFRPFWRYITNDNQDVGGYDVHNGKYAVSANGSNCFANYHYQYTEYYYLPGDTVRIMVYSPKANWIQFQIEVISVSTLESSVKMRSDNGWKNPENFISPLFHTLGYGSNEKAEFKRVNAIDQTNNEGKDAIETQSETRNTVWKETYLYRSIDGKMYRVPMNASRCGTICAPDSAYFTITQSEKEAEIGAETVDIHPGYRK